MEYNTAVAKSKKVGDVRSSRFRSLLSATACFNFALLSRATFINKGALSCRLSSG